MFAVDENVTVDCVEVPEAPAAESAWDAFGTQRSENDGISDPMR